MAINHCIIDVCTYFKVEKKRENTSILRVLRVPKRILKVRKSIKKYRKVEKEKVYFKTNLNREKRGNKGKFIVNAKITQGKRKDNFIN